ncbi:MAG: DNA gyrase inhibitor YacG [Sphingomonas bacterium]|nr:DNA gyrase inhibitor YacG [Sphingomonas bacterium]
MSRPTCPICDKPAAPDHAPFCSKGCASRDLLQWLGEGYRIPGPTSGESGVDSSESAD